VNDKPTPEEIATSLKHVEEQVRALNRRAVDAFLNQMQDVESLCEQALILAAPQGLSTVLDLPGAALALQTLGRVAMAHSNYEKALDYFQQSLRLYQQSRDAREMARARSYLGVVFVSLGEYYRAAEILSQAMHEAEAVPDPLLAAEILNDLSYNYVLAGEPELALKHLSRSMDIFRETGDDLRLSWALESMAQAHLLVGNETDALSCVQEALELVVRNQVWRDVTRFTLSAGEIYRATGDAQTALEMFQKGLDLARRYVLLGDECSALYSIAELYQAGGETQRSLPLLLEAYAIADRTGMRPHLRQCSRLLSTVYKRLGNFPEALAYHERFYEIDREIFNAETDQRLRSVQALYQLETARKEAELYQLRVTALQIEVEERRRTEAILAHAASTDSLTNLLNRRAFFEQAEKAFQRVRKARIHLSIILIDVDHFKNVNDTFGHLVGDQSLALIADRLRSHLRAEDRIARYGGEEFIVLVEGVPPEGALNLADRLRRAVGGSPLKARGEIVPVTISLGVASMDLESEVMVENLDQLVAQSDSALYAAKHQGRNNTYSFAQIPPPLEASSG
jgi:diguanylate cyclase (GGDEF)-like protein